MSAKPSRSFTEARSMSGSISSCGSTVQTQATLFLSVPLRLSITSTRSSSPVPTLSLMLWLVRWPRK